MRYLHIPISWYQIKNITTTIIIGALNQGCLKGFWLKFYAIYDHGNWAQLKDWWYKLHFIDTLYSNIHLFYFNN